MVMVEKKICGTLKKYKRHGNLERFRVLGIFFLNPQKILLFLFVGSKNLKTTECLYLEGIC